MVSMPANAANMNRFVKEDLRLPLSGKRYATCYLVFGPRPPRFRPFMFWQVLAHDAGTNGSGQSPYSSWRRNQTPVSLRPLGARSSHWYMPQRPSSPRANAE